MSDTISVQVLDGGDTIHAGVVEYVDKAAVVIAAVEQAQAYADTLFESITAGPMLQAARAAATTNYAGAYPFTGLPGVVDGVTLAEGDVLLLTAQTAASRNGPWIVSVGAWSRPLDYTGSIPSGKTVEVLAGDVNALTTWEVVGSGTVDTNTTTWTQLHATLLTADTGTARPDPSLDGLPVLWNDTDKQLEDASGYLTDRFTPMLSGIVADGTTDNHAPIVAALAAMTTAGDSPRLPLGKVAVSRPLVVSTVGQRILGQGRRYLKNGVSSGSAVGTVLVPTADFTDPIVATDAAGGSIASNVYTSSGSLPDEMVPGMLVQVAGGTGAVPTNCYVKSVSGATLTLSGGCTDGTVTSLSVSYGAVLVVDGNLCGAGDLSVDAGTAVARALHVGNNATDCTFGPVAAYGGTLYSYGNWGQRSTHPELTANNTANSPGSTYDDDYGPFAFWLGGADHHFVDVRVGGGTGFVGGGGHASTFTTSTGTIGGPSLDIDLDPGVTFLISKWQANGSNTDGTCVIRHRSGSGKITINGAVINRPTASIPVVSEEATTRGLTLRNVHCLATADVQWSALVDFPNGDNPSTLIEDWYIAASVAAPPLFTGGRGRAQNIDYAGTMLDGDQTVTLAANVTLTAGSDTTLLTTTSLPPGLYEVSGTVNVGGSTSAADMNVWCASTDAGATGLPAASVRYANGNHVTVPMIPMLVTLPLGGTISLIAHPQSGITGTLQARATLYNEGTDTPGNATALTVRRVY